MRQRLMDMGAPLFVYHGTILGNLSSIRRHGLTPAARAVWTRREYLKERCATSVFFSTSWRGAVTWAHAAHARSRGPRAGRHRRPVVIRMLATAFMIMIMVLILVMLMGGGVFMPTIMVSVTITLMVTCRTAEGAHSRVHPRPAAL